MLVMDGVGRREDANRRKRGRTSRGEMGTTQSLMYNDALEEISTVSHFQNPPRQPSSRLPKPSDVGVVWGSLLFVLLFFGVEVGDEDMEREDKSTPLLGIRSGSLELSRLLSRSPLRLR